MRQINRIVFATFILLSTFANAISPTEALQHSVDQLIAIAAKDDINDEEKKQQLAEIINAEVNFNHVSRRIVLKFWKTATVEQKDQFIKQFSNIMVDTYADLLKNYSNEKVLYVKEQIKKEKYAIVDTQIISGNKKIPVRYRMVKTKDRWKIYDFVPEGISIVSTYKKNYKSLLKKGGMELLLKEMMKAKNTGEKE